MAALRLSASVVPRALLRRPVMAAYHTDGHLNVLKTVTQLNTPVFKENAAQMAAAVADLRTELHRIQLGMSPCPWLVVCASARRCGFCLLLSNLTCRLVLGLLSVIVLAAAGFCLLLSNLACRLVLRLLSVLVLAAVGFCLLLVYDSVQGTVMWRPTACKLALFASCSFH